MDGNIRLYMEDWLKNSGIVGFYYILRESEDEVIIEDNYLEFNPKVLENFEEKYFNYFINQYEESLAWYKIVSFKDFIRYHEDTYYKEFDSDSLDSLNKYITDIAKRYLKSNSYIAAYKLIRSDIDIIKLEKDTTTIRLNKDQKLEEIIPEIKSVFSKLKLIIKYVESDEAKRYLAAKNVIYNIIKNAWEGVSFLNPQTKEKDMYIDYSKYFISPVIEYLSSDTKKFKYKCFTCNFEMKDFKNDLSFLNATGFDVARKTSHVWEFNNDVAVCPICKLVYSCVPAGFTYVYDNGIYINNNSSLRNAIETNKKVKSEILKKHEEDRSLTYRALVKAIQEQYTENLKYELIDIQVVKYENSRYAFNILTRNILDLIYKSKDNLDSLISAGYKEVNTYFNIYDLVIDSLFNTQNLFLIIHKLLVYKLSNPSNCYFYSNQLSSIMNINYEFMRRLGYMENSKPEIVKEGNRQGYFLRQGYKDKKADSKLNGIAYRLLNALKVNSTSMFMDTLLNCYLYVSKPVPSIILEGLKDDEAFKTIGYAFVSGLIEGKENNYTGGGDK